MTFNYSDRCRTVKNIGNFWHLLFVWKASVYKIVWVDLCIFLFLYYLLGLTYNFLLEGKAKEVFEEVCYYCAAQMSFIPLSFVLGFYVSNILSGWEKQFNNLPRIDNVSILVTASLTGHDDESRLMRRAIVRYLNASFIMLMMVMSPPVRKRFPSFDHLVIAGVLHEEEKKALVISYEKMPRHNIYWVPLIWATNIVCKARQQKKIKEEMFAVEIVNQIIAFRQRCGVLILYDNTPIPLVYTQVVTLAVYTFFLAAVLGRQVLEKDKDHPHQPIDIYFPLFTILQFLFYMGWLKVAETLINPYGFDDDDFEINTLIDRNLQVGFGYVDEVHMHIPNMMKDQFWDQIIPDILPYAPKCEMKFRGVNSKTLLLNPTLLIRDSFSFSFQKRQQEKKVDKKTEKYKKVIYAYPLYESVDYWRNIFPLTNFLPGILEKFYTKKKSPKNERNDIDDNQFRQIILERNDDELKDEIPKDEFKQV